MVKSTVAGCSHHICLQCGNRVRVGRQASWRAARAQCMTCGSHRLESLKDHREMVKVLPISEWTDAMANKGANS